MTNSPPHLAAEAEADIGTETLSTPLAVFGDRVCAGTEDGRLAMYSLPALETLTPVDLGGRVIWGPHSVGDRLLMAVDSDELLALNGEMEVAWRKPLAHGYPAGEPLGDSESAWVAWQQGHVTEINVSDGSEVAHVEFEQPVTSGPVPFGRRLVLSTSDGTLLVINRP